MTRLECIKSNAFLLGLDMNKATKEQKIQWLCQMIDNETDKPEEEIDFALIDECSAYLRELSDKTAEATKEQKQRILQQIKAHHNQTATTKSAKVLRPTWKTPRKIIAIAATIVLLLALTLTVIAKVNGYSSAWEYVKDNLQRIAGMGAGDRVNEDGITLIKNDEIVAYESIEELLEKEKLDILYPSELPNSVQIKGITQQFVDENNIIYSVYFTDVNLSMVVSDKVTVSQKDLQKYEPYTIKNVVFYIYQRIDMSYQAVWYDGVYEYQICCKDYNALLTILNGMKEFEK